MSDNREISSDFCSEESETVANNDEEDAGDILSSVATLRLSNVSH